MAAARETESRHGVPLTNLDQPLFDGAGVSKRDLVDYLDAVADRLVPALADRALSVIRVHRGSDAFMQKNLPDSAPDWIATTSQWADTSQRTVRYALCNDRRTLIWFANQRAVEYHPSLALAADPGHVTHLVLDLDPPEGAPFSVAVEVAMAVRHVLDHHGLAGAVKTSGAKGIHIFVPVPTSLDPADLAAAARCLAARVARHVPDLATVEFLKEDRGGKVFVDATRVGGATVVSAYSPRLRPGVPVSFPLSWDELAQVTPTDFTIHTALERLGDRDPWAELMPSEQHLADELLAEGHTIPVPRVAAMHEGKRRARARRTT